jgi:antitoxin component YwqK of YwqJK toxin-antitoxin module
MTRLLIGLFIIFLISSCQNLPENWNLRKEKKEYVREFYPSGKLKSLNEAVGDKRHGVCKYYYETGELQAIAHFHMNQHHGEHISYYRDGTIRSKLNYEYNKKQGEAYGYYENGNLYTLETYDGGKLNGPKKKYWENGKLMMENTFLNGKPSIHLKEYDEKGRLITNYPKLNIVPENTLFYHNTYKLNIYFDNKSVKNKYYVDDLVEGGYLPEYCIPLQIRNGIGEYKVTVYQGQVVMRAITVIGEMKTKLGHTRIVSREYNLAIKH